MAFLGEDVKQMLDDSAEKFVSSDYDFDSRQELVASELGYSANNWQQFAELGWLCIPFSEQQGGLDGNVVDTLGLMRLFGGALLVEPFVSTLGFAGQVLVSSDNDRAAELLTELVSGEKLAALAHEEMASRGNAANVSTRATKTEQGYKITGEKIQVLNAPQADYLLVSARLDGDILAERGIGLFLVDAKAEGVTLKSYTNVDGHQQANIQLDVQLDENSLIVDGANGFAVLQQAIDAGSLMLCAEAVGIMKKLVELTAEYLNTRKQFGVPIAAFQALRHRMADMFMQWQLSEHLLTKTELNARSGDQDLSLAVSILKAKVGEAGRYIGQQAIQLHGGIGMTDELNIGHYVKRLTVIEMSLGNTDYHLKQVWKKAS